MEQALILTPKEVGNIREYVRKKFAALPQERHAEIVADAMRRIVMKQLPDFDDSHKSHLTDVLIRSTILGEKRPVNIEDLLTVSLKADWRSPDRLQVLHNWVTARLNREVSVDVLAQQLEHLSQELQENPTPARSVWSKLQEVTLQAAVQVQSAEIVAQPAEVIPLFPEIEWRSRRVKPTVYGLLGVVLLSSVTVYGINLMNSSNSDRTESVVQRPAITLGLATSRLENKLPSELKYHEISRERLVSYLEGKQSILAKDEYIDAIIGEAENHNIHPLLLFAITGQEQGFVPVTAKNAKQIANNPFNVYHSWEEFNTTIRHSSAIAANTIVHLSEDRPSGEDPIAWINRTYAEDPNWHIGVSKILATMRQAIEL